MRKRDSDEVDEEVVLTSDDEAHEGASSTSADVKATYEIGERVKVRDNANEEWTVGVVRSLNPLKVQPDSWSGDKGYEWSEVRKVKIYLPFEGIWSKGTIRGKLLTWSKPSQRPNDVEYIDANTIAITLSSGRYMAVAKDDGKLHWSDGDIWTREESSQRHTLGQLLDELQRHDREEFGSESFDDMELADNILRGIYANGFDKPRAVQQRVIVPLVDGQDLVCQCRSGTGKTAAIIVGALQKIDWDNLACQVLILAPSRERVFQLRRVALEIGAYVKVKCHSCTGGKAMREDIVQLLKGQHMIVGTPGRICHLMKRSYLTTDGLKSVVIDEADQMLPNGFRDEIQHIFERIRARADEIRHTQLPPPPHVGPGREEDLLINCQMIRPKAILEEIRELQKTERSNSGFGNEVEDVAARRIANSRVQICIFAATMPRDVLEMVRDWMQKPKGFIEERSQLTLAGIRQYHFSVKEDAKLQALCDLLRLLAVKQSIIYCSTRRKVDYIRFELSKLDFRTSVIHADLDQEAYDSAMRNFRSGSTQILLSTGLIASSGYVRQARLVINYDLPHNMESYLQRIGRSGRFLREGVAISFVTNFDMHVLRQLEVDHKIEIAALPADIEDEL